MCGPVKVAVGSLDTFYKPAAPAVPGACTAAEIDALDNASKNPAATTWDAVVALWQQSNPSLACTGCLVGNAADPMWRTFVQQHDFGNGNIGTLLYWGQCAVQAAPSKKQSCGEIAHKFRYAYVPACSACVDDAEFDDCRLACYEDNAACQNVAEEWIGDCPPTEVNTALNKCNGIKAVATVACRL
jgi:hypothetical protein